MLVAIKYLNNNTRTGINHIEDWYLPNDAFKTKFWDQNGRQLYLVGTRQEILKEDAYLDKNAQVDYDGHIFQYRQN